MATNPRLLTTRAARPSRRRALRARPLPRRGRRGGGGVAEACGGAGELVSLATLSVAERLDHRAHVAGEIDEQIARAQRPNRRESSGGDVAADAANHERRPGDPVRHPHGGDEQPHQRGGEHDRDETDPAAVLRRERLRERLAGDRIAEGDDPARLAVGGPEEPAEAGGEDDRDGEEVAREPELQRGVEQVVPQEAAGGLGGRPRGPGPGGRRSGSGDAAAGEGAGGESGDGADCARGRALAGSILRDLPLREPRREDPRRARAPRRPLPAPRTRRPSPRGPCPRRRGARRSRAWRPSGRRRPPR